MDWTKVKGILCDVCGCMYNGDESIEGSLEAITLLRQTGIPIRFITNEKQRSRHALVVKLRGFGYKIDDEEIFSPPIAAAKLLSKQGYRPLCLLAEDVIPDLAPLSLENPNCVLLGNAREVFHYDSLNQAFQHLMTSESPKLFSLGKTRFYKDGEKFMLDAGPFLKAMEYAAGIEGTILGKPSKDFFHTALADMGVHPSEAVMIGDDIESDIGGAQACGMRGVQVRTGKYRSCDENHPTVKPDLYADNLLAVAKDIVQQLKIKT